MKAILTLFLVMGIGTLAAKEKVVYKYKKFQSFDFEEIKIEGETSGPGDISISPRFIKSFKNELPYRKNFNAEMRKGIERIK